MEKYEYQEMEQHIKLLGWIYIVMNVFVLGLMALLLVLMVGGGLLAAEVEAFLAISLAATFIGAIMLVVSVPGIVAGYGLLKRKSWARPLAIVVGLFNLSSFPVGTAVGIYALWTLFQDEARLVLAAPKMA